MFSCKRCGYSSKIKGNILNHFKRKNQCKPILKDVSIDILKEEFCASRNGKEKINTVLENKDNQEIITDVLMEFLKKKFPSLNHGGNLNNLNNLNSLNN